jgi:hypothetical protein
MTVVILTEIENTKVLTKTFTRRFYFLLVLLRVLTKTFHPKLVTPISCRCYLGNDRTEYGEMYISIDQDYGGAAPFIWMRKKQGSGETERERVCACECWSKPQIASISIHKQHG